MDYINISHKKDHDYKIHSVSSEQHESLSVFNIQRPDGYWSSRKSDENIPEYIILDFQATTTIDYVELSASPNGAKVFPRDIRFETSLDSECWMVVHTENKLVLDSDTYRLDIPLTPARYLKILIISSPQHEGKHYAEIGGVRTGIAGILDMTTNGTSCTEGGPWNLLSADDNAVWETDLKATTGKESLIIDLGKVFHVNRIILGSASKGFPENFFIETSPDNSVWLPLLEEKNFKSQVNKKYFWNTDIRPARYIRIEAKTVKYPEGRYAIQFTSLEISAAPFSPFHTHNVGELTPYASIFQAGIVRLAKDGDDSQGAAIQGNDRRLRDATSIFKGIVRLAEDGEDEAGLAVQASDPRIKPATDLKPGIVQLAHNRETRPGVVVQGNDSRLQEATVDNFGIVKICPDGMYKDTTAVTGNDSRLHKSTVEAYGICRLANDGERTPGAVVQANDRRLVDATTVNRGIVELAEDGEDSQGVAVQGSDRRLRDATTTSKGIMEFAEDGEDSSGVAVQGNDRRLKDATTISRGIVELAKDGEDRPGVAVQGNDRRLKDATEKRKGIVELAENGENMPGVAVQGNDRRLRDATTASKGIVELAEDGEDAQGVAVQGSDCRLRDATESTKGIVELAENGEDAPGVAVQGNDRRLRDATESTKGIVELAENGEDRQGVAVQGSDCRLRDATTTSKGIVELAENGEDAPGVAVQGNDRRIKTASTTSKGIVELAEDGEDAPGVAVQGNDRRIKTASTTSKGIVELAEDGEDAPGVAVQGNDRRIKTATQSDPGIVILAKNGESKKERVVQSTDPRLNDARHPLPHDHDYARIGHDFNSHGGTISLRGSGSETFSGVTPPSDNSTIIFGKNESADSGSIGLSGIAGISTQKEIRSYGVVGHSTHIGVRGQSSGGTDRSQKGCGVMGLSRFGAGGVFSSEHDYALIADGYGTLEEYDGSINLKGKGDALCVRGASLFDGVITLRNRGSDDGEPFPANLVELFETDDEEYISPGDLLVIGSGGKSVLSRARTEYNPTVIGVVSGNPGIIIDATGGKRKLYPVVLAGTALCRIDAQKTPLRPGDLVVTSGTPGCGMKGAIDSFDKIGTVVGKALDSLDAGIGLVPVFITHR